MFHFFHVGALPMSIFPFRPSPCFLEKMIPPTYFTFPVSSSVSLFCTVTSRFFLLVDFLILVSKVVSYPVCDGPKENSFPSSGVQELCARLIVEDALLDPPILFLSLRNIPPFLPSRITFFWQPFLAPSYVGGESLFPNNRKDAGLVDGVSPPRPKPFIKSFPWTGLLSNHRAPRPYRRGLCVPLTFRAISRLERIFFPVPMGRPLALAPGIPHPSDTPLFRLGISC